MEEIRCNGEKCASCKYCRKHGIKLLGDDIVAQRWRWGLMAAVAVVGLISLAVDILLICKVL